MPTTQPTLHVSRVSPSLVGGQRTLVVDVTRYFPNEISEESCWDLVAMDCIRYEGSMDCGKRISRFSHNNMICCDFPLTSLRAVKRP